MINKRFNEELQKQIDGTLPAGHVYQLGHPGEILLSAGIPYLDIEMNAARLKAKSEQANHPFNLADMMNLPKAIQEPLAVFNSATQPGSFVILTELKQESKNYVVALQANKHQGNIIINSIRSIHPRDNRQVANWIKKGLLRYANKKGMADLVSKQRCNSADVENLFGQALNIINNFQNPPNSQPDPQTAVQFR
jgi:hypothetical protein